MAAVLRTLANFGLLTWSGTEEGRRGAQTVGPPPKPSVSREFLASRFGHGDHAPDRDTQHASRLCDRVPLPVRPSTLGCATRHVGDLFRALADPHSTLTFLGKGFIQQRSIYRLYVQAVVAHLHTPCCAQLMTSSHLSINAAMPPGAWRSPTSR